MDVRDAVEADAEGLAAIADGPADVMRNLVHDRSVRVAVERTATGPQHAENAVDSERADGTTADESEANEAGADDEGADTGDDDETADESGAGDENGGSILGFVSFDARADAVHVTQLAGTRPAITRLLEEPLAFARRERMPVELLVPADSRTVRDAVEDAGFDERGSGPRFEGDPTVRYRFER